MARKAKKRVHRMPPLSFPDKLIYWTVLLIVIILDFALLFGPFVLRDRIAFGEEAVVAKANDESLFWILVPWMTFFLMTFILWQHFYLERRPIFGRRNFRYGPPAWPKVYPLFMRNKPYVWVSERTKKNRKSVALLLLVVLLVSFIPFPWALYDRSCLRSDGSVVRYSIVNQVHREYDSGKIDSVEIETYRYRVGRGSVKRCWGVRLILTTDSGKTYKFTHKDFREAEQGETPCWLTAMLQVKGRYSPEIITCGGLEDLEKVIADQKLTDEEAELLYRLFGYP